MLKDNAEEEKNEPNKPRRSTPALPQFPRARNKKGSALVKYLRYQIFILYSPKLLQHLFALEPCI